MAEYSKKLDLRLPTNHPIFSYPPGVRAQIAREWLEIGAKLERIEKLLEQGTLIPAQSTAPQVDTHKLQQRIADMF